MKSMSNDIRVCKGRDGSSMVVGDSSLTTHTFAHKGHAIAYGRALAFSLGLSLLVYRDDGAMVRESSESLTYPKNLE
jgi:hypothetical protein